MCEGSKMAQNQNNIYFHDNVANIATSQLQESTNGAHLKNDMNIIHTVLNAHFRKCVI